MIHIHLHFPPDREPNRSPRTCNLPVVPRADEHILVPEDDGSGLRLYVVQRVVHVLGMYTVNPVQVHLL